MKFIELSIYNVPRFVNVSTIEHFDIHAMADDKFRVQVKLFDDNIPKYLANGKFDTEEEASEHARMIINKINGETTQ